MRKKKKKSRRKIAVSFEGVLRGFLSERKGKVIPCRGPEDRKGAGSSSRKSGARTLGVGSIRSRAESAEGCVKLKQRYLTSG